MTIKIHADMLQGSDEWYAARCGLLTASEMDRIITPTLKVAANDKSRAHLWELLAQRITRYVEPQFTGDEMMRGYTDEAIARELYAEKFAAVREVGFVTNDRWRFTLGCSPDGLVGDDGMIECKSRRQKFQIQTLVENVAAQTIPVDYVVQVQTALLVTERAWCDFVSYSGGLPMAVVRVLPDEKIQAAIVEAATAFEKSLAEKLAAYEAVRASDRRLVPTERRTEQEMPV